MILLYDFIVKMYVLAIRLAAPFHSKARKWRQGRKNIFKNLEKSFTEREKIIWIHAASLGEFEQGRPLIESLKKHLPEYKILLTFFSPSGYEIQKDYPLADYVFYLPADTRANAKKWMEIIRPSMAVFIKYEFWYHYLTILQKDNIPVLVVSALFRPNQYFFKWYGGAFKKMLERFTHIFVQNEASAQLLSHHNIHHYTITGDTRIDRVAAIAENHTPLPAIEQFKGSDPVFICGSTWAEDEALLIPFIQSLKNTKWKFIIAPHEISESHLSEIEKRLSDTIRFSQLPHQLSDTHTTLIIDNIGLLSRIYYYGKITYIGGGFGKGIHNILEPAAHGLPVIFGKNHNKFEEANTLIQSGGAFNISDYSGLKSTFHKLEAENTCTLASGASKAYINKNKGATLKVMKHICSLIKKEKEHLFTERKKT